MAGNEGSGPRKQVREGMGTPAAHLPAGVCENFPWFKVRLGRQNLNKICHSATLPWNALLAPGLRISFDDIWLC